MAVDEHELAVGELPREKGIGLADLREQTLKRRSLLLRMTAPVLGVWDKLRGPDAAQFLYSIANVSFNHRSSPYCRSSCLTWTEL